MFYRLEIMINEKFRYEVLGPAEFAGDVADEIVATVNDTIAEKGNCSLVL